MIGFDPLNYKPRQDHLYLGEYFYRLVKAAQFPQTKLRFFNKNWATRLGMGALSDEAICRHFGIFDPLPNNLPQPLALTYHGHQFHHYNPDLGDGRGFLFAQLEDPIDGRLLDLATKGSGTTPFSRLGDGRLTLKGGVREVLASLYLEALGLNTSKAFSLIETGEQLERQDEPSPTRSAVLVRLGHSHIRFGTFQRLAYERKKDAMAHLVTFCLETYQGISSARLANMGLEERVFHLLEQATLASASLVANWFATGFVHGVLNSDNMNINGESFDYGPFRFMPAFEPGLTAAYFDHSGLYAFGRQPEAVAWNLERLAEALFTLFIPDEEEGFHQSDTFKRLKDCFGEVINLYGSHLEVHLIQAFMRRLWLKPSPDQKLNQEFTRELLASLQICKADFESFLFALSKTTIGASWDAVFKFAPHDEAREHLENLRQLHQHLTPVSMPKASLAYFSRARPVGMLYDEIEALWLPISRDDDWSAFQQKCDDLSLLRAAVPE